MANKRNSNIRSTNSTTPNLGNKRERNEFLKNHPVLYVIAAIVAFTLGNYLFDFIGKLF